MSNLRINSADDETADLTPVTVNTGHLTHGPGILATARTPWNTPAAGRITERTVVTDPESGMQTSVGALLRLGVLQRDGDSYRETGQAVSAALTPPTVERNAQPLPDRAYAAQRVLRDALHPSDFEHAINNLVTGKAAVFDGEAAHLQGAFDAVAAAFRSQAAGAIEAMGAEADHFYAWALQNAKADLYRAAREHYWASDPSTYVPLVDRYLRMVPPNPTLHGDTIEVNGMTTSTKAAAKAGII
jgi:hypothetical protein